MKFLFQKIREKISRKRQRPNTQKNAYAMVLVPIQDFEIMKLIRMRYALGLPTEIDSFEEVFAGHNEIINEAHYVNATILNQYYGINKKDLFYMTGCVL